MLPALVLTAGLGTRLDPITRLVAKAAVPLAGRTLIERVLGWLGAQGVTDVVLNLHYLPETITSIVGDGAHLGMRVRYSWESPILGSAGGPRHALPLLEADTFAIVNGDTLCDVDLAAMHRAHAATGAEVTMAVVPNPAPDNYNGLALDATGRVTAFVPKGRAQDTWHFVGVQIVNASVLAPLPDGVPLETVSGIYRDRIARGEGGIYGYRVDAPFLDVGTPQDYLAAALRLARPLVNAIEAGADIAASARVSGSVVWGDVSIGDGAALSGCIAAGVSIPPGFRAHHAVLLPPAHHRPGDRATVTDGIAVFDLSGPEPQIDR